MNTLHMKQVVLSVDLFTAISYVVCRFFYAVLPDQAASLSSTIFHGIESVVKPFTWGDTIVGLVGTLVLSTLAAVLFVIIYNNMSDK